MVINLLAIFFGILMFSLILLIFGRIGEESDKIRNRMKQITQLTRAGNDPDDEMNKPLSQRFFKPILEGIASSFKRIIPQSTAGLQPTKNKRAENLRAQLRQAGIKMDVNEYNGIRVIVMVGTAILLGLISFFSGTKILYVLLMAGLGVYGSYAVMRFMLAGKIRNRHNHMEKQLPDVLDMLSVSVDAGLGLEQAMAQVVDHYEGPLIDEIAITNREMALGRSRKEALLLLGERCGIEEMRNFVRSIVQATQMGISMKKVLRSQAQYMRQTRRNKVEEKAMKVSIKILLPMGIFIFPVIFIVLIGPAVAQILEKLL